MGVLACSRKGCENIMCDTYVPEVGYVCKSCQQEFKNYIEIQKPGQKLYDYEIKEELKFFITFGVPDSFGETDIDSFFDNYTSR